MNKFVAPDPHDKTSSKKAKKAVPREEIDHRNYDEIIIGDDPGVKNYIGAKVLLIFFSYYLLLITNFLTYFCLTDN